MDVAGQTEIGGVENLVCAGVVEDGLGVDAGLVGEGAEAGDGVVEGGVDLDSLGNHILDLDKVSGVLRLISEMPLTSLSMWSLYLLLTYSGLVTTMRARRPPRGVIPLRSPTIEDLVTSRQEVIRGALTAENTGVNVGGTSLKGAEAREQSAAAGNIS